MKIYCSQGACLNKCYSLNEGIIQVGRSATNDIIIKDGCCSRKHAIIIVDNGIPYITSVKQDNPVILDNYPLEGKAQLISGQCLEFGDTIFNVIEDEEVKPRNVEDTHRALNDDVRKALRGIMSNDMLKVSCEQTTRIKRQAFPELYD